LNSLARIDGFFDGSIEPIIRPAPDVPEQKPFVRRWFFSISTFPRKFLHYPTGSSGFEGMKRDTGSPQSLPPELHVRWRGETETLYWLCRDRMSKVSGEKRKIDFEAARTIRTAGGSG